MRRRWLTLGGRVARLLLRSPNQTPELVCQSYDRVAAVYDDAWTRHMRDFTLDLLDRLAPPPGAASIDLTCGTGFVAAELARRTSGPVIGVDASSGMLAVARRSCGSRCAFVQADAAAYLRACPPRSADVITCAWGLGYSRPWRIVRAAARVLRPGGRLGIIDNTLFSLSGVLWASVRTFAERPEALVHVMRVRFLPAGWSLAVLMRAAGLSVRACWDGARTYRVLDGAAALARLTSTGAAAGFEFAAGSSDHAAVFARFAEVLEEQYRRENGIPITHRYLAAIGHKR